MSENIAEKQITSPFSRLSLETQEHKLKLTPVIDFSEKSNKDLERLAGEVSLQRMKKSSSRLRSRLKGWRGIF